MRRLTTMYGVAAVFLGLNAAGGATLYAESSNSGDLITINSVTGASTVVGHLHTAEQSPVGLAYNSATDTMYTRDFNNLYSVNRATAATTLIGTSAVQTSGLAFNPAHTLLYSVGTNTGGLYTVNPATGAESLVGTMSISQPLDLSFNSAGNLYVSDFLGDIYSVNPSNGTATFVSHPAINLWAIGFDANDSLFGAIVNQFERIALPSGALTPIGNSTIEDGIRGIALGPQVPEPGSLSLAALALGGLALLIGRKA